MTTSNTPTIHSIIAYSFKAHLYSNALFYAERLFASSPHSQLALYLVAKAYYFCGKIQAAYTILKTHSTPLGNSITSNNALNVNVNVNVMDVDVNEEGEEEEEDSTETAYAVAARYLFAKCCLDLNKLQEGVFICRELISSNSVKSGLNNNVEDVPDRSAILCLEGLLLRKIPVCRDEAISRFQEALSLNPFLWTAIEELASLGVPMDLDDMFQEDKVEAGLSVVVANTNIITTTTATAPTTGKGKRVAKAGNNNNNANNQLPTNNSDVQKVTQLIHTCAESVQNLQQYQLNQVIHSISTLPRKQQRSGWAMCIVGRAHYELGDYATSERVFSDLRRLEPYRMEGMDYYSAALWQLRRDVALSYLAHQLVEFDRQSPQAWIAVGNCFSLKGDHDSAIKSLKRATQLDPTCKYAHKLLGDEYYSNEDLNKALHSYRESISCDARFYNAWGALAMLYFRQEKFDVAKHHFERAWNINSSSAALMMHVGLCYQRLGQYDDALACFERAISIQPTHHTARYQRANTLAQMGRFEDALEELFIIRESLNSEANVHHLMGKIYRKLGQTQEALLCFTKAQDLFKNKPPQMIREAIHDEDVLF